MMRLDRDISRRDFARQALAAGVVLSFTSAGVQRSGNPILPGWYADPEARIFNGEYWIYPT